MANNLRFSNSDLRLRLRRAGNSGLFAEIYKIIRRIPTGKVATYGQVAALAGHPGAARTVGWALSSTPDDLQLPWHRVINASGRSSLPEEERRKLQQALLEAEGVVFDENGKVNLEVFQWDGK